MKEYVKVDFNIYYDDGMGANNEESNYTYFLLKEDVLNVRNLIWSILLSNEDYYGVNYYKTTDYVSIESIEDMYLCYLVETIPYNYDVLELKGEIHANIIGSTSITLSAGRHQYLLAQLEDYAYDCGFVEEMPHEERGEIIKKMNEYVIEMVHHSDKISPIDIRLYGGEEE
ncbi:hypothetical protein QKV95_gp013 [Poseidoniales virus YSH_150918]|uniref:Uncharacterized protein n=1 Tax=Poseidoniales virus YSH_150918 TaxID=3071324 RepID=A0A976YFA5_9CAUD|nr:hypothetical protein QKV95_gp013 [Yangshan Harbor Poseidoniales virus]UVF62487.1 hypothetical protein [Poseidoniales virus YSH_150918]